MTGWSARRRRRYRHQSVMRLLRLGPLAFAIVAVGSPAARRKPDHTARPQDLRRAHAAALRVGALAGARLNVAPQAVIAAEARQPAGATPADADGARRPGRPDQHDEDQRNGDRKNFR